MTDRVLVDSTVWIGHLRDRDSAAVRRLRTLLAAGAAVVAPIIVQELLQGAASAEHFETLRRYVLLLPLIEPIPGAECHVRAAKLYARCRWQGLTPRGSNDCLIASIALERALPLLHDDRDFERLAEVEPRLVLIRG